VKAHALSPEQAELVSRLLEQKFESQVDQFEDGKCPEMALALAANLPQPRLCVGIRQWKEWGEYRTNQLSHVVVCSGTWDFDAGGNWASLRWEEKWDDNYSEEADQDVTFRWQPISQGALVKRIKKYREDDPEINWNLVAALKKDLAKLLSPCLLQA
jgi:hypothetical protein